MDQLDDGLDDDVLDLWEEDQFLGQHPGAMGPMPLLPSPQVSGPSRWAVLTFMALAAGAAGWILWKVTARRRAQEQEQGASVGKDETARRERAHALATATRDEEYAASLEREAAWNEDEKQQRAALRWKLEQERRRLEDAKARRARWTAAGASAADDDEDDLSMAQYAVEQAEADLANMQDVMADRRAAARSMRSQAERLRKGAADLRARAQPAGDGSRR